MSQQPWYEKAAWLWFALLSVSVLPLALWTLFVPSASTEVWSRFGYVLPGLIAADQQSLAYVQFIGHWAATGTIGFDLFGLAIALTAFRRGERWAWLVFWYWPVLFAVHFVTYTSAFRYAQLMWLSISVAALLATRRRVWIDQPGLNAVNG